MTIKMMIFRIIPGGSYDSHRSITKMLLLFSRNIIYGDGLSGRLLIVMEITETCLILLEISSIIKHVLAIAVYQISYP